MHPPSPSTVLLFLINLSVFSVLPFSFCVLDCTAILSFTDILSCTAILSFTDILSCTAIFYCTAITVLYSYTVLYKYVLSNYNVLYSYNACLISALQPRQKNSEEEHERKKARWGRSQGHLPSYEGHSSNETLMNCCLCKDVKHYYSVWQILYKGIARPNLGTVVLTDQTETHRRTEKQTENEREEMNMRSERGTYSKPWEDVGTCSNSNPDHTINPAGSRCTYQPPQHNCTPLLLLYTC